MIFFFGNLSTITPPIRERKREGSVEAAAHRPT